MKKPLIVIILSAIIFSSCKKEESTKPAPAIDFIFTGQNEAAPAIVTFYNSSVNSSSYLWDFGDGSTSIEISPQHTYSSGGSYNVRLTATGSGGSNTLTKSVYIGPAYTICKITNVSITSCPLTSNGSAWDPLSGPDFYFNLENSSGGVLYSARNYHYTDYSSFPQFWNLIPIYSISEANWFQIYKIHIWEWDTPDTDDNVSTLGFSLIDYVNATDHYPYQISISNGTSTVIISLSWI